MERGRCATRVACITLNWSGSASWRRDKYAPSTRDSPRCGSLRLLVLDQKGRDSTMASLFTHGDGYLCRSPGTFQASHSDLDLRNQRSQL